MTRKAKPNKLKFYFEPLPVPDNLLDTHDTWQTICVRIPIPLIGYITPVLRIWESSGCLIGTGQEKSLFKLIISNLIASINTGGSCEDTLMLRQNPANLCQLQQSFDGGMSWLLAFDYSLCTPAAGQFVAYYQVLNLFAQWANVTSNTEINQYAPTTTFTSSPDETENRLNARKQALCYAVDLYVHAYVEAIRKINHDSANAANVANLGFALLTALAALFTLGTSGAGLPVYMAVGAAAAAVGVAGFVGITDSVLNDSAAIAEIVCCMYSTLKDLPANRTNFASAVNSCTGLSANAELIRTALARDISAPANLDNQFNAFINLLGDELRPAELGLLPDCVCETNPWTHYFDLTGSSQNWAVNGGYGIHQAGTGFTANSTPLIWLNRAWLGVTTLTGIRFVTTGEIPGTHQVAANNALSCFIQGGNDATNDFTVDLSADTCYQNVEEITARVTNDGAIVYTGTLVGIELSGIHFNPFL